MKIKTYSLEDMKERDLEALFQLIYMLGFSSSDYRVVYFGSHSKELKIMNSELHWVLKSISKLRRVKQVNKEA